MYVGHKFLAKYNPSYTKNVLSKKCHAIHNISRDPACSNGEETRRSDRNCDFRCTIGGGLPVKGTAT